MASKPIKRNKRSKSRYPAVDPQLNLKTRYEEIEDIASYFKTLPDTAKDFMHSFVEEYVNAKFDHKGKKIYRKKVDKRAIYNRNNARNRDVLTKAKACGQHVDLDSTQLKKSSKAENLTWGMDALPAIKEKRTSELRHILSLMEDVAGEDKLTIKLQIEEELKKRKFLFKRSRKAR